MQAEQGDRARAAGRWEALSRAEDGDRVRMRLGVWNNDKDT